MQIERRFIFRGRAAIVGGRISRPSELVIDATGASALTVAGGASHGKLPRTRFGTFARLDSATTSAAGLFENRRQVRERTYGRVREDALTPNTIVKVNVKGLVLGASPALRIGELRGALSGTSPSTGREPSIKPGELRIAGVDIGGHTLVIELQKDLFSRYDTCEALLAAVKEPTFASEYGMSFPVAGGGFEAPSGPEGMSYGTIVRRIRWKGTPYPNATIEGHVVVIPGFGTIYFGEIFVTAVSRRLTLFRAQLGSPIGGAFVAGEMETNGSWYP